MQLWIHFVASTIKMSSKCTDLSASLSEKASNCKELSQRLADTELVKLDIQQVSLSVPSFLNLGIWQGFVFVSTGVMHSIPVFSTLSVIFALSKELVVRLTLTVLYTEKSQINWAVWKHMYVCMCMYVLKGVHRVVFIFNSLVAGLSFAKCEHFIVSFFCNKFDNGSGVVATSLFVFSVYFFWSAEGVFTLKRSFKWVWV